MRRHKWIEEPTETEEVPLEETQEYRVPGTQDEAEIESGDGFEEVVEDGEDVDAEYGEFDDEDFVEDELVEDDEYFEDEYVDETGTEEAELEPAPAPKKPYEPLAEKLKAGWLAAVARARKVELPGLPELPARPEKLDSTLVLSIAAIALVSVLVGVGAFFIGKGSGDSVDQARLEGQAAGASAGAINGASGYGEAFKVARENAFEKAYLPAYRQNFKRVYEEEGLEPPAAKDIQVPQP
ncbi:MAG: hypothetical protein WBW62_05060 [Solirubrobacterales bacterium]